MVVVRTVAATVVIRMILVQTVVVQCSCFKVVVLCAEVVIGVAVVRCVNPMDNPPRPQAQHDAPSPTLARIDTVPPPPHTPHPLPLPQRPLCGDDP